MDEEDKIEDLNGEDIVNWVEPDIGFMPPSMEYDLLSILLRNLIAQVKDDHAMFQYRKDLKDYVYSFIEIIKTAEAHGYKLTDIRKIQAKQQEEQEKQETLESENSYGERQYDGDLDLDSITD